MKKIFKPAILICGLLSANIMQAQMKDAYDMKINGVKVIVQPSGNDILEIRTIIKGGVQNYPAEKAGIENLAFASLTECGTAKDDKNVFKDKLDKLSAQMYGYSDMDHASFAMNCVNTDFDAVWSLYVDAMTQPKFDEKEFARVKNDAIVYYKASISNPDFAIRHMAKEIAFAGRNYAKEPQGSEANINRLTAAETKKYYKSILTRSRMLIVVVGDIKKEKLQSSMQSFLSKVPAGTPFALMKESYTPSSNSIKTQKKDFATNYIVGITSGPAPGTPDYNAYMLAMRIFRTRHFIEIRTNNGLSYAPSIIFNGGLTPYTSICVSTTDPNKYAAIARKLIDKTKKDGFTEDELKNIKTGYVTQTYYQQETNAERASALANAEVLHGDWKRANTLKDDIKKITTADLSRVFNRYMNNITWAYMGDVSKVDNRYYTQKETPSVPGELKAF